MTPSGAPLSRFQALVERHSRLIAAVVARVGGRAGALHCEDIRQEVLVALWKQVEREQIIEHPASYVYRAAVRETVRFLRRELRRSAEPAESAEAQAPAGVGDPLELTASRERARQIESCLTGLAPDRGRAVRAHLAGFEVTEIMQLYAWPYQRARNLVARGMADLRSALLERGIHG